MNIAGRSDCSASLSSEDYLKSNSSSLPQAKHKIGTSVDYPNPALSRATLKGCCPETESDKQIGLRTSGPESGSDASGFYP
jgi:hypothetical protein